MSRCHPFPPPGYVKNAPLELELLPKKEKHKHKDKKKKRKKSSSTNDDLVSKEDDRPCTYIEQSGQSCKRLCVGSQKGPLATVNEGIIEEHQIKSFVDDAVFNCGFATDSERELRLRSGEESRSKSMLSADRLHGESTRSQPSKSVHITESCHSFQGVNPVLEGLSGSCLANASKRVKLDTPTSLSNHVPVISGHQRPEQPENSKSLIDVFSTKCKRLQAKHSAISNGDDHPLLRETPSSDCNKYDALHTGSSRTDVLMCANNGSATLQAGFSKNASISKNRLPTTDVQRSEKKPQADQSSSKPRTNGSCCKVGQALIGKDREAPHFLLENGFFYEKEKLKPEMQTNGAEATRFGQMQMNSSTVQKTLNGMQTTIYDKSLQSEKLLMMNSRRHSSMIDLPAKRLNEVCSLSSASSNLDDSKQKLHNTANGFVKAFSNAKDMLSELECTKQEVSAHATSEKKSHRQDLKMQYIKDKADKTHNRHVMLANSYVTTDSRLQVDTLENSVTSNCVTAGNQHSMVGIMFTPPVSAANGDNRAPHSNATHSRTIALNFEDNMMKKKLLNLRIPQPEQHWVTNSEQEDWLVSCKQQLQSEEGKKVKMSESQQVWAEAVLLQEVGLTALPFVVLN